MERERLERDSHLMPTHQDNQAAERTANQTIRLPPQDSDFGRHNAPEQARGDICETVDDAHCRERSTFVRGVDDTVEFCVCTAFSRRTDAGRIRARYAGAIRKRHRDNLTRTRRATESPPQESTDQREWSSMERERLGRDETRLPDDAHRREHSDEEDTRRRAVARAFAIRTRRDKGTRRRARYASPRTLHARQVGQWRTRQTETKFDFWKATSFLGSNWERLQ